jgi:hypothetical protein
LHQKTEANNRHRPATRGRELGIKHNMQYLLLTTTTASCV